ncbi:hypothetical protein [Nocardia sp. NPDC057030]|uniref:hypothetical protein n=1 Tax=unclassified Nocardia TaxID=2637762 RepID=UPI00362EB026
MSTSQRSSGWAAPTASVVVFCTLAPLVGIMTREQPILIAALGVLGVAILSLSAASTVRWFQRR